jgi:glycosyltransferase involved in cell wall biosynthesis
MLLAFDGAAFCRSLDSIDRVLRVLVHAVQHAGWDLEIWTQGDLRPDAARFRPWVRPWSAHAQSSADVLWSPDIGFPQCDVPVVATLHDVNPLLPDGRGRVERWIRGRRFRRRVGRCLAQADHVVTDTENARGRVAGAFPQCTQRLSVVPLFVDPDIQPLKGERGTGLLEGLGISPGFILFVGSLRRHKNWDGLIRAYAALPASLRERHALVFAGRAARAGSEAERLAGALGVRDRVRLLGVVDEEVLHALYGAARLLACPSFMEGFGFPPLEAMACGLPVVATDRTCVPEVLGDAGVYVNPASIESITGGLASVLEDEEKYDRLVEAGRRQAGRYGPARTAAAMKEVFARLSS